ncbi:MAG: hypothetical protein M3O03_09110 [Pseudomonadota bacterium]|nr:hypothetical protein [Pseudomonadota bacterium]
MKNLLKISVALSLAVSSLAVTVPSASAQDRHRHDPAFDQERCMDRNDAILPLLFVGAALGAVTGGVGSAVIWGSAYAVGGAAVGGGAGLLLSSADNHRHCN